VIIALLDTACRLGELLSLQWRDVNLDRREVTIRAVNTKTREARMVPISSRLVATLDMRRLDAAGQPFGPHAYVFGTTTGERVKSVREAWTDARTRQNSGTCNCEIAARGRLSLRRGRRLDELREQDSRAQEPDHDDPISQHPKTGAPSHEKLERASGWRLRTAKESR
jgi:integrase